MAINCLPTSETDKSVQLVRLSSLTAESKMPTVALKVAVESYFGIKVMAQCTVMGSAAYKGLPFESLLSTEVCKWRGMHIGTFQFQ